MIVGIFCPTEKTLIFVSVKKDFKVKPTRQDKGHSHS